LEGQHVPTRLLRQPGGGGAMLWAGIRWSDPAAVVQKQPESTAESLAAVTPGGATVTHPHLDPTENLWSLLNG